MNDIKRRKIYLEDVEGVNINYSAKYRAIKKIERDGETPDDQVSFSHSSPYSFCIMKWN